MSDHISCEEYSLLESCSSQFITRDGKILDQEEKILKEHSIEIYLNDMLIAKAICIAQHLEELVLGRLLTEGIILSKNDVSSLSICDNGTRANVQLTPDALERQKIAGEHTDRFRSLTPISWKTEWIFHLADALAKGMPLHMQTSAIHSCFIAIQDQILFECEDIGRHNALDKVIGYCLIHDIDLHTCIVYSSGRVPTDMVSKVIHAGIPIFCSKGAPTKQAIDLARKYHLTLFCQARSDRIKRFA